MRSRQQRTLLYGSRLLRFGYLVSLAFFLAKVVYLRIKTMEPTAVLYGTRHSAPAEPGTQTKTHTTWDGDGREMIRLSI